MTESNLRGKKPPYVCMYVCVCVCVYIYIYINPVSQISCLFPPSLLILSAVLQESFDCTENSSQLMPQVFTMQQSICFLTSFINNTIP